MLISADFQHFGFASSIGEFESGSPEWLELRRSRIGGSDVASIMGWSKWTSAYALWALKTGRVADSGSSEVMEWGSILEPVIRQRFADKHPEWLVVDTKSTFVSDQHEFLLANPDGLIFKSGSLDCDFDDLADVGLLEIKTARFEDDWVNGIPRYYQTQLNHYLWVLGLSWAKVAVLFGGSSYKEFDFEFDQAMWDETFFMVDKFYASMVSDVAPDWDGSTSTYETVRVLNPSIVDESVDLGDLGVHLGLAASEFKAAEAHLRELKSRTLDAMGLAKYGHVELDSGEVIRVASRESRGGGLPFLVLK